MSAGSLPTAAARPVDVAALCRVRSRLHAATAPPWLHLEVARRMAERLSIVRQQPHRVLDWWSRTGAAYPLMRATYPRAQIVPVESDDQARRPGDAAPGASWWSPRRWRAAPEAVVAEQVVEAGSAQLVWANMGLHAQPDPLAVMVRWHRALAVDGFLMFSTLGPGTLAELRALYRRLGWPSPHAPFVDMHDLGDMLVQAGFADPVMDQEQLTLHWPGAEALLDELRGLGGNVDLRRFAGLRTPRWHARLVSALQEDARVTGGRPSLTFEIVYGHAVRVAPRPTVQERTTIDLADMRSMVATRRR